MKHNWLFNAMAVLFLVTGLFGGFANTPVAVAAPAESNAADKIEPALLDKFNLEGTVDFIIRFNEQVDLSPAYGMDWDARGEFVYNTLKDAAALSQARAKGMLDAAGLEYETFIAGNDLYVKGGNLDLALAVAALDEVYYIRATRTYSITPVVVENPLASVGWSGDLLSLNLTANIDSPTALAWGIADVKADQFWTAFGVQGGGIKVANIDTGVQYDHPALDQTFACLGDPTNPDCWLDPSDICPGDEPCDNNGHGTHTMGTMVADDDPSLTWQAGMAPDATWIACKGCETSGCSDTALNACADWILAPGGDTNNRPNVVNNSWGGGGGDPWYLAKVNAWRAAGVYPAFSSGNPGSTCGLIGSPSDYQESFASGGYDSARNVYTNSGRGPSVYGHDPYTKPNISAPAVSVCSTIPTDSWSCGYTGTSMASPHSAGAVALLWSCNPSLIGQIDQTFELLQNAANTPPAGNCSAPPDGEGNYTFGYGYLDVLAAGMTGCGTVDLGTLEGYVYDSNANPIEGATVSAQGAVTGNGINATTDPTGFYTMDLVVGTYDVTASKQNYTTETQTGVQVISGTTTTLPDFVLGFLGAWTLLDPLPGCPDWTRYDGEYSEATGMVYFLGGRSDTSTFGDIYELDPGLGSCTDTGTNMITAISNYQIVPLTIGGDEVLCTFGGRDSAGNNTDDVQCYDPVANTVSNPTNLPASLAPFTPAAAVGVNNMAYVFGGFRATAAPYESAETWEWNPATDTWTQKGNLVLGLGYIQATAVDGLIYGFGGTVFDGTNLVTQVKTQVFDPVAGTWDDASVAELPTAGAEGRVYGFDSASAYELAGQIVVAGGGQWPAETPAAYLYDIASDSYDESFPDLNISRRDHAGVFVPGDPGTMWVFGGRTGVDTPPYAPPEYYAVELAIPDIEVDPTFLDETVFVDTPKTVTLDVMNADGGVLTWTITEISGSMMLVDQDVMVTVPATQMSDENVASRMPAVSYPERQFTMHISTISLDVIDVLLVTPDVVGGGDISLLLNTLAVFPDLNVVVWDGNAGTPTVANMQAYDVVFVGNDILWTSSTIDKTTLSNNLADYVDVGGKVLIGSFVWSYDDWGFGGGRFITEDYSPFEIATSDIWDPTTLGTFDPAHPVMAGITSVTDNFNHQDPALSSSGTWVASWADGENFVGVSPNVVGLNQEYFSSADFGGQAGELLHNALLYLAPAEDVPWLSEDPTSGQNSVPVDVTFDPTGMAVGEYYATLQIDSNDADEPTVYVPVTMTVIEMEAGVLLTPEADAQAGDPGVTVAYTLTLENTGNITDTFTVEAAGVWDANLPVTSFELAAGEMADVVVEVTIPADAMAGESDLSTVTATSAFDDGVSDFSELTTTANQVFGFELAPATDAGFGAPGETVTYTLQLTNTGNGTDTYELTITPDAWEVLLPVTSFELAAGEIVDVIVLVTVALEAGDGDMDIVTITATSDGDGSEASSVLTTTAMVVAPPEGYMIFLPFVPKN